MPTGSLHGGHISGGGSTPTGPTPNAPNCPWLLTSSLFEMLGKKLPCIRAESCENCEVQMVLPLLFRVSLKKRFGVCAGSRVMGIRTGREIKMSYSLLSILSQDKAVL